MEYLFAAALAIIVLGALALTVRTVLIPPKRSMGNVWVKCEKCGYEFEVDADKHPEVMNAETPAGKKQDCPKCGAKKSAWVMSQCPACGKRYVRPSTMGRRGAPDTCPFCKADFLQALDEKIKREVGKK